MAENVTLTAVYNILFTNDVVCGLVVDFVSQLKKSPYYRFYVKQQAKRIESEMQKYEKRIAEIAGKKIFLWQMRTKLFLKNYNLTYSKWSTV